MVAVCLGFLRRMISVAAMIIVAAMAPITISPPRFLPKSFGGGVDVVR